MTTTLAIIGYGKMGTLIDKLAAGNGFEVVARIDLNDDMSAAAGARVAIDFSTPDSVVPNVRKLAALGIPIVVGTTGWFDRLPEVIEIVDQHGISLIWSPNFSVGVQVFLRIVREAAALLADEGSYGAWAWEVHHATKRDAPSGTLLKLVAEMKAAGYARPIDESSSRAGANPGTHEIGFDSEADTITLRHSARSREGFALGALRAAQWLVEGEEPRRGVFEFGDRQLERR